MLECLFRTPGKVLNLSFPDHSCVVIGKTLFKNLEGRHKKTFNITGELGWFQLYVYDDLKSGLDLAIRAQNAGYKNLILNFKTRGKSQKRKIIVATNVAETSITIPNLEIVIDIGKAKISDYAPWSGLPILSVKDTAQDSSIQRAGRAGRTREGLCIRLYSEDNYRKRARTFLGDAGSNGLSGLVTINPGFSNKYF